MNIQCLRCKGRHLCSREFCPIQVKIGSQKKFNIAAKKDYFGESPNVFIGRYGYPNINVGILSVEDYQENDNPLFWSSRNYSINTIVDLRSSLVNSQFQTNIKTFNNKMLEISQEISQAVKPADVEINLEKKPSFTLSFNQDVMPHGPRVKLKKAQITENPRIPKKVDKAVSDYDFKANDAINSLYESNFDEHYLTKILSVGNIGVKTERKLVPTRWAITAVDDAIAKKLRNEVKDFNETNHIAFFGGYLGNYYLILFFPNIWRYELFEAYVGKGSQKGMFATDYENYRGRKSYADNTAGGYYAARMAILEKLKSMKRQGSCLCLRFITEEYWAPLGVWVVREATRNSMKSKPIEFSSEELMLRYARNFVKKKFGYDLDSILRESRLLKELKTQKRLVDF